MPLYEYECPGCGRFERMQKFSDPILTVCPTCEKPVEKLPSAPAIQFKGAGWYVTDYAGKGKDKDKDKDKETKGKEGDGKGKEGGSEKTASEKSGGDAKKKSESAGKSSGSETK